MRNSSLYAFLCETYGSVHLDMVLTYTFCFLSMWVRESIELLQFLDWSKIISSVSNKSIIMTSNPSWDINYKKKHPRWGYRDKVRHMDPYGQNNAATERATSFILIFVPAVSSANISSFSITCAFSGDVMSHFYSGGSTKSFFFCLST